MLVLVDTNVLLRAADPAHPACHEAVDALAALTAAHHELCIASQNLVEYRTVSTRPVDANGLGLCQAEADAEIARLESLFRVLADVPGILPEWKRLTSTFGAAGKQNHDARIAAAMSVHGVAAIVTFNRDDFARYTGIVVVTPADVLMGPLPAV